MKKLKGSFRTKMLILTMIFVTIPILVSGYITKTIAENNLLNEKEKKLYGVTQILDQYIKEDFNAILQEKGALEAEKQTKIKILNAALSEYTDSIANAYPGIGVGYYVKDLEAIVTYGPSTEHGNKVGSAITSTHPGNRVMKTGEKEIEIGNQVRGPIMNAMLPIIRDGEVLGYVWANELMIDVENQLAKMDWIIFIIIGLGIMLTTLLLLIFWSRVLADIGLVKQGLQKMRFNLKERIIGVKGEIGEIASEVNNMASSLLHARTLTENVMESMVDGVITVDMNGNITFMNQAAMELTGVTLDEIIGKSYCKSLFKGVEFNSPLLETLKTGKSYIGLEMDYPVNGRNLYISSSTSQLLDSDGKLIGAIVTFKDITDKKHLEQQIYRADRLAALGEMIAGVAHEIRNPLAGIKSLVQYLQEGSTEEERQEFQPLIVKEVDRVNKIIEELLYFARPSVANITPVNMNQLIHQTVALAKNISKKNVHYHFQLDEALPDVEMDSEQFKQVFLNIFINSAQAMNFTGNITVESVYDAEQDKALLHFTDTGPGIDEELLEKVFDPFFTTKKEGTGIGMAVVQRIVSAHNGEIFLKNNPADGLKVTIRVPIHFAKRGM